MAAAGLVVLPPASRTAATSSRYEGESYAGTCTAGSSYSGASGGASANCDTAGETVNFTGLTVAAGTKGHLIIVARRSSSTATSFSYRVDGGAWLSQSYGGTGGTSSWSAVVDSYGVLSSGTHSIDVRYDGGFPLYLDYLEVDAIAVVAPGRAESWPSADGYRAFCRIARTGSGPLYYTSSNSRGQPAPVTWVACNLPATVNGTAVAQARYHGLTFVWENGQNHGFGCCLDVPIEPMQPQAGRWLSTRSGYSTSNTCCGYPSLYIREDPEPQADMPSIIRLFNAAGTAIYDIPASQILEEVVGVHETAPPPFPVRYFTGGTPGQVLVAGPLEPGELHGGCNPAARHTGDCHGKHTRDPIDSATGNFFHTFEDITIPGRGVPLSFTHTNNSLAAATDGPLGYGWTHSYNARLAFPDASTVVFHQENGAQAKFTLSSGSWRAAPRVQASLAQNGDGTWTVIRAAKHVLTFDASGRLTGQKDLNGYTTTLSYTAGQLTTITDPAGRSLNLTWTGPHITRVADLSVPPRTVDFMYDANGDLVEVIDVNGGHTTFTYDTSHRVRTMRAPRFYGDTTTVPAPEVTNHYDGAGRIDWQSDPLGRTTSFDYTTVPGATIVTDPRGNKVLEEYTDGVLVAETKGYGTAAAATWVYSYDPTTAALESITDPNGHRTTMTHDARGNLTSKTDALAQRWKYAYNKTIIVNGATVALNVPTSVTEPVAFGSIAVTTTLSYDTTGNLTSIATPLLSTAGATLATRTTTISYDPARPGDATSVMDPNNKTWVYGYDAAGNRITASDPLGNVTRTCYGPLGRPTAAISPRGSASGVTCATPAPAAFTSYATYDAFGQLTTATNALGKTTVRTYDANRNPKTITDPNGNVTTYTYDAANQPTTTTRADTTTQAQDYWPDGRLRRQYDGSNQVTAYDYDARGRLITVTDPLGRTTTYGYDGAGNPVTKVDPGGTCAAPAAGCTTFGYDAANQLTSINYSDSATPDVTALTYDGRGRRLTMVEGTGGSGTSSWAWDSLGRMASSTNGAGKTVGYGYDLRGQLTSLVYPGTTGTVTRTYDDAGRPKTVTDWLTNTTTFNYDADSNPTSTSYPNGTTATHAVDNVDRASSISHAPTTAPASPFASFSYGRDNNGQVGSVNSTGVPTDSHTYDYSSLNQLKNVDSPTTGYRYDPADNLTQLSDGVTQQNYDVGNQLTASGGVSFVGSGAAGSSASTSASVTFSTPASADDQILVASTQSASVEPSTPAGYTVVGTFTSTGTAPTETVLYRKKATGGETSVTINYGVLSVAKSVVAAMYRGVDPTTPVDAQASAASAASDQSSIPVAGVTPTRKGDRLVFFAGAAGHLAAADWTSPSSMTERAYKSDAALSAASVADEYLPTTAATGSRTATFGTSAQLVGVMVALRAAHTSYTYDSRGNRTQVTLPTGAITNLGYDQANRLTTYGPTASYKYDGDGLRVSKTVSGTTSAFTWAVAEGVPQALQDGTMSYVYDATGRPLQRIGADGTVLFFHHDQLGSTRALTNAAGAVVATATFDAYGRKLGSTGSVLDPFGHAGQYTDAESGLQFLRARYYDAATGQFLTRDPMEMATRSPYGYVDGDPLNAIDPLGLDGTVADPGNPNTYNPMGGRSVDDSGPRSSSDGDCGPKGPHNYDMLFLADWAGDFGRWSARTSATALLTSVAIPGSALVAAPVGAFFGVASVGAGGIELGAGLVAGDPEHVKSGAITLASAGTLPLYREATKQLKVAESVGRWALEEFAAAF